ncbi:hypothetical protein FACS189445_0860 [Spirochaetia bacterium]|nr:hypothetical protein FACS189445_0860 [Spirochaetia bacterium]
MICVSESDYKIIKDIIARYAANCEVRAFGSRYKWTSNDYSDLDLAFAGDKKLTLAETGKIRDAFEESDLPFRVDVLDLSAISKEFQAIINQGYEVIYSPPKSIAKGWRKVRLGDVCEYRNDKIETVSLDTTTYISTENMLPEKTGVTFSAGLPATQYTQKYSIGNVLISNIRPYFKKIWLATQDGGCSNDVLIFKAKENYLPEFLYYILSDDKFFDYSTQTAKGTKMPRGDKTAIMNFMVPDIPLPTQYTIAATLSCLDDKIELNNRINANLEAQAQAIFKSWFVDFEPFQGGEFVDSELGKIPKGWQVKPLYDYAQYINGTSFKDEEYSSAKKGYPIIKIVELKNGITDSTQYCNCDKEEKYFISNGDILFSWSGNPETSIDTFIWHDGIGILNQHTFKVIPNIDIEYGFIYFLLRYKKTLFARIASNKQTTGLGHVTIADLKREKFVYSEKDMKIFCEITNPIFDDIFRNLKENRNLAKIRDILLPRLMSGEIEIGDV